MATNPTLRFGNKGPVVHELQQHLNLILPIAPLLKEDGVFGQNTHGRVKSLQTKGNLTADGVVGPNTWGFIANLLETALKAGTAAATAAGVTTLNPARHAIAHVAFVEWMMHGALVHAHYKGALDPIRKRYHRLGWEYLTDYFGTALPNYEQVYGKDVTRYLPHSGQKDALPAWCGIFAFAMLRKAMQPVGTWVVGGGAPSVNGMQPTDVPRKGDVAYREMWNGMKVQHHAIVYDVVGTGSAMTIVTIDGNSGAGSSVTKNEASRKQWDKFYKVKALFDA